MLNAKDGRSACSFVRFAYNGVMHNETLAAHHVRGVDGMWWRASRASSKRSFQATDESPAGRCERSMVAHPPNIRPVERQISRIVRFSAKVASARNPRAQKVGNAASGRQRRAAPGSPYIVAAVG